MGIGRATWTLFQAIVAVVVLVLGFVFAWKGEYAHASYLLVLSLIIERHSEQSGRKERE